MAVWSGQAMLEVVERRRAKGIAADAGSSKIIACSIRGRPGKGLILVLGRRQIKKPET